MIDPGRLLVVEITGARFPSKTSTPGVSVTGGAGAIAPVAGAGVTSPKPLRKTAAAEPAIAGLVQSFNVPSALRATAASPIATMPPHTVYPGNGLAAAADERKTAGCRSTTPSVRVSDKGSGVCLSANCIWTVVWPAIS